MTPAKIYWLQMALVGALLPLASYFVLLAPAHWAYGLLGGVLMIIAGAAGWSIWK